jgi:hypothetical protein
LNAMNTSTVRIILTKKVFFWFPIREA